MKPISPSQINTWRECPRKWAFSRFLRDTRGTKATRFGSLMHAHLERWLTSKTPPPDTAEGRAATAGLHLLPEPGSVEVERAFEFEFGGVLFAGRIDWQSRVGFGDHKSIGNLQNAKTPAQLRFDPQRIIYALAVGFQNPTIAATNALWVYYQRSPTVAHAVEYRELVMDTTKLARREILPDALAIKAAQGKNPRSLPQTLTACANWGGCPYEPICKTPKEVETMNAEEFQNLIRSMPGIDLAQAQAMFAAIQAEEQAPEPEPAPQVQVAPEPVVEPVKLPPKKRGRKPKSETQPVDLQTVVTVDAGELALGLLSKLELLNSCAQGGLAPALAAEYLDLLAKL